MSSPYDVADDKYCYKGTAVLKNKMGLRDPDDLSAFELEMSTLRGNEDLPVGEFDSNHYRSIHRHLFQDVYRWAGKDRTVRTAKGGNMFCYPENIKTELNKLCRRLSAQPFLGGASKDDFCAAAANFLADLNAIHCFREGNGRAQLAFMHLVAQRAGHPIDLKRIEPKAFLRAMIESFAGDTSKLRRQLLALSRR